MKFITITLFTLIFIETMGKGSNGAMLRRSVARISADETIMCRITLIDTMLADEDRKVYTKQAPGCIPIFDNVESEMLLSINLTYYLRHEHSDEIKSGNLFMQVSGANLGNEEVVISDQSTFLVLDQVPDHLKRRLQLTTKGTLTVMVVRMSSRDGISPVHSLDKMRSRLFGYDVGMRSQFKACSYGQLVLEDAGGLEVKLSKNLAEYSNNGEIMKDAERIIMDTTGKLPHELADKVMFCYPPETGGWIAFAGVNHWRSSYNNAWCLRLSATMHEMGHNLGLLHSGVGDGRYEDETGYMGYGSLRHDGPQKCFNGYKNHQLGWYETREIFVDPSVPNRIELAAFADFEKTAEDQPVLLNIEDHYFIQYNRAKLFNSGTSEKKDAVTITENNPGFSKSIAGLYLNEEWAVDNYDNKGHSLVVKVCYQIDEADSRNKVDSMIISIGLDADYCGSHPKPLTNLMTSNYAMQVPTNNPTTMPSSKPTHVPTSTPTMAPTESGQCTCMEDGSVHFF